MHWLLVTDPLLKNHIGSCLKTLIPHT